MELIITENTTIEEYEAWLSHPDTTIKMMREASEKWSVLIEQSCKRIEDILEDMKNGAEQEAHSVSMDLLIHVAEQEAIMEGISVQAREILLADYLKSVAPRTPMPTYDMSEDTWQFEVALIDALEAKKFRSRVKNALVRIAAAVGAGWMVIHNLL